MKKILFTILSQALFAALWLCASQAPVSAAGLNSPSGENDASLVFLDVSCGGGAAEELEKTTDSNQYSSCYFDEVARIRFEAESPVRSIYIMFGKPCVWTVSLPDGSEIIGGENQFLHECVVLESSVTAFELNLPAGSSLTDVYAFTEGSLPDWVQIWQPPCKRADLMLMPTHADDEHLWFGGAMPYYAGELGYNVQVVYLTNHANEPWRGHELLNGLWLVGVRNYPIITDKFIDDRASKPSLNAAENFYGRERVLEFQVEMLRRFSPRVIIAHDINGEYGHGAHILNASTLLEALKEYEDPSVFPESAKKYGIHKVQKCYLHLWEENQITVQWSGKTLDRFGGRTAFEMAREGYHCHASQLVWQNYVLEFGAYDCRKFGLAYTTVGYDTPGLNDMFENVDWSEIPDFIPDNGNSDEKNKSAVSDSDSGRSSPFSDFSKIPLFNVSGTDLDIPLIGKKIQLRDAAFAVAAAVVAFIASITAFCLTRRK